MDTRSDRRALVTGATGFTGGYLCEQLLKEGYSVLGMGRHGERALPEGAGMRDVDLLDTDGLVRLVEDFQPTHVFHLAGVSFVAHGDAAQIYETNTIGTENLIKAVEPVSPQKVLIASSANIYGNNPVVPVTEDNVPMPVNHYGCSKLSSEYIAHTYMNRVPIIITRPFNYTGPGQDGKFLVPKIVGHFRDGAQTIELGNVDVIRDFSDVRDIAAIYAALAASDIRDETVNLCSGRGHSLADILSMMSDIAGYEIAVTVNPAFVRQSDIRELIGSRAGLDTLIGAMPRRPFRQTLQDMYEAP